MSAIPKNWAAQFREEMGLLNGDHMRIHEAFVVANASHELLDKRGSWVKDEGKAEKFTNKLDAIDAAKREGVDLAVRVVSNWGQDNEHIVWRQD
jgi:hypothetical protein